MPYRIALLAGLGLVIMGAFLTWSDNPPFSEAGYERAAGLFALVAAIGAAVISLLDRRPRGSIIAVSASVLIVIAAAGDLASISSGAGGPGAGLWLSLAGAAVATAASGIYTFRLFKKPTPA